MSDYTPTATEIFGLYTARAKQLNKNESTAHQEFTRWLNEVKARALDNLAQEAANHPDLDPTDRALISDWCTAEAKRIREGEMNHIAVLLDDYSIECSCGHHSPDIQTWGDHRATTEKSPPPDEVRVEWKRIPNPPEELTVEVVTTCAKCGTATARYATAQQIRNDLYRLTRALSCRCDTATR